MRFPSTYSVYTDLPSLAIIDHKWTGIHGALPADYRPANAYTQDSRPRCQYSQYGRECRAFYLRIPVHRPCIRKIPVPAKSMQYTRAISTIHHFAPSPSRYLNHTPSHTRTLFYILLQFCIFSLIFSAFFRTVTITYAHSVPSTITGATLLSQRSSPGHPRVHLELRKQPGLQYTIYKFRILYGTSI